MLVGPADSDSEGVELPFEPLEHLDGRDEAQHHRLPQMEQAQLRGKLPERPPADESVEPQPEEPVAMAPVGSRLADVAKSAAIKAERAVIEDTLRQVHWNRRRAAEQLGVSYKTLLNKIKECGISRK